MGVLLQAAGLFLFLGFTVGPLAGLMAPLNRRDRRQGAIAAEVSRLLSSDLRDRIHLEARAPLLFGKELARTDMAGCSASEIMEALARWSAGLPPDVRLTAVGALERGVPTTWRIETGPARRPAAPPRPADAHC